MPTAEHPFVICHMTSSVDGLSGTPAVFDFDGEETETMGSRRKLDLTACERLSDGVVWLRYRITTVEPPAGE